MIFFSENGSQLGVFGQGENFKLTKEVSEKSPIIPQPDNQERLKWSNTAYVNKWSFTFETKLCAV